MGITKDRSQACSVETTGSDVVIFRNSILTLTVTLQKNAERNFYCEKSNYITSQGAIMDCSEAAVHSHPFSKISPGNTGGRVLFWPNLRLTVQSSDYILK